MLWDILLLKFLWDGHKAHEAWLSKPPTSRIGALIKIPFLLLEFLFRLVILGPLMLVCVCIIWGLAAPTSFTGFTHWFGTHFANEANSGAASSDIDKSPVVSNWDQNATPGSLTPNIDRLERIYGDGLRFDYVSDVWGTQLPQLTAADARRIITDRELSDSDYIITLPRDETAGHAVLVDKRGKPILAIRKKTDFSQSQTSLEAAPQAPSAPLAEVTSTNPEQSTVPEGVCSSISAVVVAGHGTIQERVSCDATHETLLNSSAYVSHSFNRPQDLMWLGCADGYKASRPPTAAITLPLTHETAGDRLEIWGVPITGSTAVELQLHCILVDQERKSARKGPDAITDDSTRSDLADQPSSGLPPGVFDLISKWVSTVKDRDIQTHLSLYAESVDQFYTKRNLSHTDLDRELNGMYRRYAEFSTLKLSNLSWNQVQPDVLTVDFDKHFEATRMGAISARSKIIGDVRSELVLRRFENDWKITSESDPKIYSISH